MSQAAVDLPDHLDKSADPLQSPDELLSQLAGNEIDRLLAEADAQPTNIVAPAGSPPVDDLASQLDDLFDELQEKPAESAAPAAPPAPLTATVDAELAEKTGQSPAPEMTTPTVAPVGPERDALLQAAGFEDAKGETVVKAAEEPIDEERSSVLAAAGFESADGSPDEIAGEFSDVPSEEAEENWDQPLPMYLKPLEWMNAPFESLPQGMRELLGKAAIVTLVNALAVLGYLLIFKKH